ncbi:SDR family oxidoreductase [Paenibacillus sp. FSL H3-0333]|uniref:SDR family oxidoreductase n=1 Tax=Paenibacillus sp. FSL H3-0333 TaxID=2921373 RepID=UPI004046FF7E
MHTHIRKPSTKGAIVSRSGMTPLIPASFSAEEVSVFFGTETPFKRAAQPYELAGAYVYLASDDASYVTGTCIHVNGGDMITS